MKPTRLNYNDGTSAELSPDGDWDVTLPSGKHVRGNAPSTEAAKAAVKNVHDAFILERWNHGRVWGSTFEVPLR